MRLEKTYAYNVWHAFQTVRDSNSARAEDIYWTDPNPLQTISLNIIVTLRFSRYPHMPKHYNIHHWRIAEPSLYNRVC